ncbi:hypothetical protein ACSQ67_025047 [Phaseolus vulgaris]
MDLELGLKITKTRDDVASISEYRFAKAEPIFQSRETNTAFILTAHLKGYKKNNINIKISEDGSKISISGEKPVQNILMMGWLMHRKEVDVAGFNKVFKIPDGVKLNGVKAKYDEEEWIMNIIMPKFVKGICGAKIEEIKEEESSGRGRRSEQEKSEGDHIPTAVGETSQKGSKESEVQAMEDSENTMEKKAEVSNKMLDDSNRKIIKDRVHKEVEEPNVGTDGGNGGSFGEVGKEGYEVKKTSEPERKVGVDTSQKIGEASQKEIEELDLKNEDERVKGTREEVGKTEAVKTLEKGKSVGERMPRNIGGDKRPDKEFEVQEMENNEGFVEKEEKGVSENMLDDGNANIIGEMIQKEQESKSGIKDRDGESVKEKNVRAVNKGIKTSEIEQNVGAHATQDIGGDKRQDKEFEVREMENNEDFVEKEEKGVSENMLDDGNANIIGEVIQKEQESKSGIKERDGESVKEKNVRAVNKGMKTSEIEQNVGAQVTHDIGGDKRQDKEFEVKEMEDNEGFVEKEEKGVNENMLDDGNARIIGEVIQKEQEESKSGTKDRDGESVKEKNVGAGYKGMKRSEIEQNVGAHVTQNIGDPIQGVCKESAIEQMGESKSIVEKMEREEPGEMLVEANVSTVGERLGESSQKQFGEPRSETEDRLKESVKESRMETMKAPELDQNVDDQIPTNIGGISQEEFKESRIQWKEKTESIKENMDGGKSEKIPIQASKDGKKHIFGKSIQENIKKPKIENGNGDQEYDGGKAGKKEIDSMVTREEFPQKLPKSTIEESKRLSISKMQEIEDVEEAKIKRKLKENEYSVHKDEGEELRRMHKETKKELAKKTLRENEDVKKAMDKRDGTEIEYSVDKSEGEEHKRRHTEAKKDLIKETMKKNETAMDKREDREIEYFVEAWKDLTKKIHETEDVKEEMSKRRDEEIEKFVDKGEGKEPSRLYVEAKDLKEETTQESEDIQEAILKREGKNNEHFSDKRGEKPKSMHMEAKNNIAEERMQETKGVKEAIVKRKQEIGNFTDMGEGEEPTKIPMNAKKELTKETKQENEKAKEVTVKRKDKETEHFVDKGQPKSMHVEAKKDLIRKTIQESEHAREAKGYEYFADKGEESKRMHMELKKDIPQEAIQEKQGVKEAMIKRKGKEIENFADKEEGEAHKKVIMKAKKVSTKERKQEGEKVKEAMVKWKSQETEDFANRGEDEEPKSLHMEVKKDLTIETIQEREDVKEARVKREGKDYEYFVDKGVTEEPKGMHIEPKKDIAKEKLQEIEGFKEAMVNIKGKEIANFVDKDDGDEHKKMNVKLKKESTKETKQVSENVKEAMVKRKGNETKYFVDKGEGEEPKSTHVQAKKELTADTIQEDVREGKHYECFVDNGEGEETKRMLMERKNIAKETMQAIKGVKEAMVKRKGREIENLADKDEAGELTKMLVKSKKEITKETKQQSEKIEEAMVKRKGKETEYFLDKDEDKEHKSMCVEAKKNSTAKTTQESEDVIEAMVKREGKGCGYFVDKGESEEPKRMNMEPKKDITKETMPKTGVKEARVKTKDKEIGNFADKYEGEEHINMLSKEKKELPKGTKKEREKFKEAMVKKKGKETEYFGDKGEDEELVSMHVEAEKDLTSKTIQEGEDVKEAVVETEGKDYEYFVHKDQGEELKMTNMEAKKNTGKESMQETKGAKEAISKTKGKEIGSFAKGEGKETKKGDMEAKKNLTTETVQESDGADEGNENKCFLDESEGEANRMYMETKEDFREETLQESENVKKVKVKSEGKDIECFADKSEDKESIKMLMGTKRDLRKEEMHENDDVKEAIAKRKGKEIEYFVDNNEGEVEEPKGMHVQEKKDLTTKTMQEIEDAKEAMVKSKVKEIENFADKAKGKESKIREAEKDSTKVTMKESDDTKEAMVKRKGKEVECFVDKGEEPKWMHTEAKKNLTNKTIEESEVVREAMVKREGEEEMDYFLEKGEDEKDITKQKIVEKIKHGITDNDQQNVLGKTPTGKSEVPTEEGPKLVREQDGSRGRKVSNMEDPKEIIKEEMAAPESLMKKVQGEKHKSEEASRVIQKNTATEILQKETDDSNNERKSREGPNVPNNMVKVVFEVLGTFQAKLPKQVMEAIVQNKKDKNEYVIVKLKGEGSIKMHVEPNEALDEDETHERSEKEVRKPKLKSSDQISGKENVDFGVFDGSKRPKFLEMGETQGAKEDSAQMEESANKINGDQYEEIQVDERGRKSSQKGKKGPKILVKDQHRLQEEMNIGRSEASKAATEEFPMKTIHTFAKTREETKDKEVEELTRRKSEETNVVESTIEEKVQAPESGRIPMTCKEVPQDKHPEELEIESPDRELQSTKGQTTSVKVASGKFKELEQDSAKDKTDKTKLLPAKIQTKGIRESEKGVKQNTIKPKKEKGEQFTYNIERNEEIARFPSTHLTKVGENYQLYEGGKAQASTESQKEGPTKDTRNLNEMKDHQGSKQRKTLKSEIPMEILLKKEGKVTKKDENHKEQKIRETMQAETERPKEKIVDRDQQCVQRDVADGVGKVDTVEKEMPLEKTNTATEDKMPKIGEITPEIEKASGFKQDAEKTHESSKREHQRESLPKLEVKPPIMTPKKEVEKSKKEEGSPMPTASQRKEPRELSLPSKDYKIPKIEEVQQKKEGKRPMHALEATTSKEGELAQAIATHSKAKSEIDEQQVNQLTSPTIEMRSIEPRELEKRGLEEDGSKAMSLDHMQEGKEFIHSTDSTAASEIVADEAGEPTKFLSLSSTQPFEVEGKDEIDASCDDESQDSDMDSEIDGEASTKGETDEEVVQRETLQPESPEDQQCTHKALEESHGTHEIEEEKADEHVDEADEEDSQQLEEQKECEEEAIGGKEQKGQRN